MKIDRGKAQIYILHIKQFNHSIGYPYNSIASTTTMGILCNAAGNLRFELILSRLFLHFKLHIAKPEHHYEMVALVLIKIIEDS